MNRFWYSEEIFCKYQIEYSSELDLQRNETIVCCMVCTFHKNMRLTDLERAQHYRHTHIKCIRITNLLKNGELLFHCMRHITSHIEVAHDTEVWVKKYIRTIRRYTTKHAWNANAFAGYVILLNSKWFHSNIRKWNECKHFGHLYICLESL